MSDEGIVGRCLRAGSEDGVFDVLLLGSESDADLPCAVDDSFRDDVDVEGGAARLDGVAGRCEDKLLDAAVIVLRRGAVLDVLSSLCAIGTFSRLGEGFVGGVDDRDDDASGSPWCTPFVIGEQGGGSRSVTVTNVSTNLDWRTFSKAACEVSRKRPGNIAELEVPGSLIMP